MFVVVIFCLKNPLSLFLLPASSGNNDKPPVLAKILNVFIVVEDNDAYWENQDQQGWVETRAHST